jgi:Tfp pilus assembly protein PilF
LDKDELLNMLGDVCYRQKKWNDAEKYYRSVFGNAESLQELEAAHGLAQTLVAKKQLSQAKCYCTMAIAGKMNHLGNTHASVTESLLLMVEICKANGEVMEAEAYKALVPASARGSLPAKTVKSSLR